MKTLNKILEERLRGISSEYDSDYEYNTYISNPNGGSMFNPDFIKIYGKLDSNLPTNKKGKLKMMDKVLDIFMDKLLEIYSDYKVVSFRDFIKNSNITIWYSFDSREYNYKIILNDYINGLIKDKKLKELNKEVALLWGNKDSVEYKKEVYIIICVKALNAFISNEKNAGNIRSIAETLIYIINKSVEYNNIEYSKYIKDSSITINFIEKCNCEEGNYKITIKY